MLPNSLSIPNADASANLGFTKVAQLASGSIFKRNNMTFGQVEEIKVSHQITKKDRSETLIDNVFTSVSATSCDVATAYTRVFIKIDRPVLLDEAGLIQLRSQLATLINFMKDESNALAILNGES